MSPRAACRLERLGFSMVRDYAAGIADWKAAGLPVEGHGRLDEWVADATRFDVPTCSLDDTVGEVRRRTSAAGWDECVVVDCDGMVAGRIRGAAWDAAPDVEIAAVMEEGPSTVRPDQELRPLVKRMEHRGTKLVLVTTPQGVLLGALLREEATRVLAGESPARAWQDCEGCPGRWAPPA